MSQPTRIEFMEEYQLLTMLRAKTKSQIDLADPLAEEQAYMQSLLYRCLDLGYGSFHSLKEEYLLTSLSAARSLIETIISTICYHQEISLLLKEKDIKKIDDLRAKYLFSQRHPDLQKIAEAEFPAHGILAEKTKATNIIKQLDKCRASYPELIKTFEWLSEHTHPNALGSYHFFTYEDKKINAILINQYTCKDETIGWIKRSLLYLEIFDTIYDDMEKNILPALKELLLNNSRKS